MPYKSKEKAKEQGALYYQRNRARIDLRNRQWSEQHSDSVRGTKQKYYANNKDKCLIRSRDYHYRSEYGVTPQQVDAMLAAQGGVCAICKTSDPGHVTGRFCLDHDHKTGKIRGLLCNSGIGHLKDDPELLKTAVAYLETYR